MALGRFKFIVAVQRRHKGHVMLTRRTNAAVSNDWGKISIVK